jgi:hypothetical protein
MADEILNSCPQRPFAEQDEPFQAGLFDAAHKPLSVRVGMSLQMRRMARLRIDVSE